MKVLLYTEGLKTISKSGLGKAIRHQKKALEDNKIDYTTNLKDDFDILHVNFYGPKSYFYTKKMRKKGKKIVYHAHSTEEDFRNSFLCSNLVAPLFKKWICKCYRLGDQIITPTEYSKRLLENYNLNRPIKAISNGVDTKFFERDEKKGEDFRKKYGYKKEDKIIVGIGLYIERKGILDFVELAKRLPEYKFIWFGYSPLAASPAKIRKAVNTKLDNLHFAGYVESEIIKSALSGANLYLFPTLEETEGIPIIEALTSKIPTLIRDIPVFEEYEDKRVVYKAKNLDEFEEKIKDIIEGKLPNLTEEGYKLAKKKDTEIVGKELIKTYEETLKLERIEEKKTDPTYLRSLALILSLFAFFIALLLNKDKVLNINNFSKTHFESNQLYTETFEYNDDNIIIKLYSKDKSKANKVINEIKELYSYYKDIAEDEVNKLNDADGDYKVSDNLYNLIKYGINWYDKSEGYINIAAGELNQKYINKLKKNSLPSVKEIKNINTDIKKIELKDNNIVNLHGVKLDLTYILDGYISNKIVETLSLFKIDSYIITTNTYIITGINNDDTPYRIVLDSPFQNDPLALSSIKIKNQTFAVTSLHNDNYKIDNIHYSSIINPKDKISSNKNVSVGVVSNKSDEAIIMSKYLFMIDSDEGQLIIDKMENTDAIWSFYLDEEKITNTSSNFYKIKE